MKNSEYWKLRFEQLEQAQNGQGAAAFAEIEKQYKEAQKQIEGQKKKKSSTRKPKSRLKGKLPGGISGLPITTELPLHKPVNI